MEPMRCQADALAMLATLDDPLRYQPYGCPPRNVHHPPFPRRIADFPASAPAGRPALALPRASRLPYANLPTPTAHGAKGSPVNARTAVFPGSFDPLTNGHLDIIRRAAVLFDKVIVAVGHNPDKKEVFTQDERVTMIRELVADLANVRVAAYQGLTIDFVRESGGNLIIRGIRDAIDVRDELQAANTNLIVGGIETVFLMASDQYALTSSTFIKQIVTMGGETSSRLSALVPTSVLQQLRKKLKG